MGDIRAPLEALLRREEPAGSADSISYHVRFPLPTSLHDARFALAGMCRGLASLVARFEADRYVSLARVMETFGARETLAGLRIHEPSPRMTAVLPPSAGSAVVH